MTTKKADAKKTISKILVVALAAATITGTSAMGVMPESELISGITVSAADTLTYGDFEYIVEDGTVKITKYIGTKVKVNIPKTIDKKSVTSIGGGAFSNTGLTNITIPSSVTSIGGGAFGYTSLTSITIPDSVTSIGDGMCQYCKDLTSIKIGNGVPFISRYTFHGCEKLTNVTIGKKVTSIGIWAFGECTNLKSITIPNNVTKIKQSAFYGCTGLTKIIIPDSVTSIGDYAFCLCSGLTNVTIGNGVTSIGQCAFGGCINLESVYMGNSVTSIKRQAFEECTSLKSITIPKSVTLIDYKAFNNCTSLESLTIDDSKTEIYSSAFNSCTSLKDVIIPESVTKLYDCAFANCTGLTSITIPDSVKTSGYIFDGCKNLTIYSTEDSHFKSYATSQKIPFVAITMNNSTLSTREIKLGDPVTVNAKSSEANCTYAVFYKKKTDKKWTVKQNFSKNTKITIKPAKATDYDVCVKVKNSKGDVTKRYFTVTVLGNTSTLSATTVKTGTKVTAKCSASGGIGETYQYAVYIQKKNDQKWYTKQDFSTNANVTFTTAKVADYKVCIKVKDASGTVVKKYIDLKSV